LNHALSFRADGGERRTALPPVLCVRPNRNPMGATRVGGRGGGGPTFVILAPNVTCLYPREGNCHAFVTGPPGAAVLDVLFPPYDDDDDDRGCTYYERGGNAEDDNDANIDGNDIDGKRRRPLVALSPIDQPDDFNCLGGSYGRFGLH
jgi:hypothetical protein